jgi:glycosyltransferase involved in cell wall biosynthesis
MKRLLIVDPDFLRSSPSMKGVLRSLPELRAAGFEIEVWCWEIESDVAVQHVIRLPTLGARKLKLMQAILFSIQVTLLYLWRFQVRGQSRPDVVYSIVPYLPFCDVAHAHFSPWNWIGCMERMGCHSLRDRAELMAYRIYRRWSDFYLSVTSARLLIVPSRAVAEDYQKQSPGHQIVVLPNSFDRACFHPGVRAEHRDAMRAKLGYGPQDCVFIFVSMGHHRRKGFFLAVEALAKLRQRHSRVRFLVVGGTPSTLEGLQQRLNQEHPGWREWMHFTGMVTDTERHFAAADGFLYPSWSEALALVEIEAAECALPVFLTPHHGSEMVIEDGMNGLLLPHEPAGMADVLETFVTGQWQPAHTGSRHGLDAAAYAAQLTKLILESSNPSKLQHV